MVASIAGFDDPLADGPTRNVASSQIACVNFLLPLNQATTARASLAVLAVVDDDVAGIGGSKGTKG